MTDLRKAFARTYCSQCGGEFGSGDAGYSGCSEHDEDIEALRADSERLDWLIDNALTVILRWEILATLDRDGIDAAMEASA
jgi:hypothetical protein